MEMIEEKKGKALIIEMKGRFDSNSSPEVEKRILDNLKEGYQAIILDFNKLEYISSAGIRVLVHAAKEMEQEKMQLAIASVPKQIENVLYITGFLPYFQIFDSVDKTLSHFKI